MLRLCVNKGKNINLTTAALKNTAALGQFFHYKKYLHKFNLPKDMY